MKNLLVVILSIFFAASTANAEPDSIVRHLMNTPVSEFSFGLWRLERRLIFEFRSLDTMIGTDYDWDENSISVSFIILNSKEASKEACAAMINRLREDAGYNAKTGELYAEKMLGIDTGSAWAHEFAAEGYSNKNIPKNHLEKLDTMFTISVMLIKPPSGQVTCMGKLLSSEVWFK